MNTDRSVELHMWKLCLRISYILLLYCCTCVKGVVEISPSAVAPVCQVGDQLELTCTTTGIFLRWEITVFPENVTHVQTPITSVGNSGIPPPLMISSSTITLSRLSGPNSSPLISGVVVNPVSSGLNGTVVNCFEGSTSTDTVATTTIQVIDPGRGQFDLSIQNRSETFLSDEVTVNLEWTFINLQTYYQQLLRNVSVSAKPKLTNVTFNGNMTVQLVLSYNTLFNVNVTQHSICQQLIRTELFELKYSKCSDPMEVTNARALGYVDPALEGQNITFVCPSPGQAISGPNSSICMGNGEWDPDPGEVECTGPESTTTSNYATMQLTDCMTCSGPNTDTTLGVVLGIIFGIILASTITFVVVLIIILNKKRITGHLKHPLNTNVELDTHDDNHNIKNEGTLVYADIGQHPALAPVKSNTIHLDDSHVEYALLDHSVQKHKASTLQESSTAKESDNCPSVNLDSLLIQLRPQVDPKWYQFGEAAGIEKEVLDKFAEQCPPDECIVELFDYWLRNSTKPPTWKTVADVLKAINLTELGRDIEEVYTTGMLPIEVDMNRIPELDTQLEEEPPPPLPARSANLYIDAPSHICTVQADSQGQKPLRAAPSLSNEMSAPALPPKPPRMKSAAQSNLDND